jgi:hypothetical protein
MNTEELKNRVDVTVVFPAYNEFDLIEIAVTKASEEFKRLEKSFEIVIAEDGSSDGTAEIAGRLSKEKNYVRHIHSDERLGRGKALNRAFKSSRGSILVYMDVDLATKMSFLRPLIASIENGADLATGSRMLPGSVANRSMLRGLASRAYNGLVRGLLGSSVRDHQCGFKAFRRESLFMILDNVKDEHWFWDTEIIAFAVHKGFRIEEIPIVWREGSRSKVRVFSDSINMGYKVISLWWRLKVRHDS